MHAKYYLSTDEIRRYLDPHQQSRSFRHGSLELAVGIISFK